MTDTRESIQQELEEALEDFRKGVADREQIKLLAWSTCIEQERLERMQNSPYWRQT
jgi:hypothetical protein